ncbi:MAG: thioredoxin domain-containing protein [Phycisphaerae bacterium]|jgi:uncharacterized protein YyaL (SSP411 family)|nr:MAG: thioredoxin domain-containing protein [Phycisphaerae bacterium]
MPNRLADETSPYLQQHQNNPVDWYPWGPEAFEAARSQDRPIFLSVGYSTCYWCHVMERQCFENESIARLMNQHFINIKVDREERPDVDALYMTALQVMTRQGGWPMSLWLTPDLKPFFGGTYFPPVDMNGRSGFPSILTALAEAYRSRRQEIEQTGNNLVQVLQELAEPIEADQPIVYSSGWVEALVYRSIEDYEPKFGGFGSAPKFPRQTLLELLLHWINYQKAVGNDAGDIEKPLRHTLDMMANGGIRDHLGGGFHRYSTDDQWLIPHFEIMLYDNAMLGWIYAEASRVFDEPRYETVARGIFDFVLNEMTDAAGGFYTAFDAEVDAHEGLYYLWTMQELEEVLSPREAARFAVVYGLDRGPNFADPHHSDGTPTRNVLYLPQGSEAENDPDIISMRKRLYQKRLERKKPLLDTKIITHWNALMIRALAHAGDLFGEVRYLEAARSAVEYICQKHASPDGGLYHVSRDGFAKYPGFLDDYASMCQALIDLHRVTKDAWCLQQAHQLTEQMCKRFEDPDRGGFYFTDATSDDLIIRQKIGQDTPLPAGNAQAAMVCDTLGRTQSCAKALGVFAMQATHHGQSMSTHVQAVLQFVQNHGDLRVEPGDNGRVTFQAPQAEAVGAVAIRCGWKGERQILVELTIASGYHLSAQTRLESPMDVIEHLAVPPSVRKKYAYADEEQLVLEGRVRILVTLKHPPEPGQIIPLRLTYQVCTDSACLPTVSRGLSITR